MRPAGLECLRLIQPGYPGESKSVVFTYFLFVCGSVYPVSG